MTPQAAPSDVYPADPPITRPYTGTVADWPLFFVRHNFGAICFDTQRCNVVYAGMAYGPDQPTRSAASYGADYEELLYAGHIGIANFPPPATIGWTSKDGATLDAEVDIAEIFKGWLVLHNVDRSDIPERISIGSTDIVLEVNDRTINVYTKTHIPLKAPRIPGNRYSDFQDELIKVFSRTY